MPRSDLCGPCRDQRNRDKVAATKRAYYQRNRDKVAATKRAYYQRNRDKVAGYQRAYRERNRPPAPTCHRCGQDLERRRGRPPRLCPKCRRKA